MQDTTKEVRVGSGHVAAPLWTEEEEDEDAAEISTLIGRGSSRHLKDVSLKITNITFSP